ncbi:MAG: hypothetical protein ACKVHE_33285, partial [Planctomycetales bacterium]
PFHETTSECLVCGRMRTVGQSWLQAPTETFSGRADSEWMQAKILGKHDHWWVGCSTHARPKWFAASYFGCGGGIGGVSQLHQLAISRGEDVAKPFVREYQQLLIDGDLNSIREFIQNDVHAALTDPTE